MRTQVPQPFNRTSMESKRGEGMGTGAAPVF